MQKNDSSCTVLQSTWLCCCCLSPRRVSRGGASWGQGPAGALKGQVQPSAKWTACFRHSPLHQLFVTAWGKCIEDDFIEITFWTEDKYSGLTLQISQFVCVMQLWMGIWAGNCLTLLETLEWQLTVFSVYNFGHLSSYSHVRAETDVFKVFLLPGIWPLSVKMTSRVAKREKREAIKTVAPDLV